MFWESWRRFGSVPHPLRLCDCQKIWTGRWTPVQEKRPEMLMTISVCVCVWVYVGVCGGVHHSNAPIVPRNTHAITIFTGLHSKMRIMDRHLDGFGSFSQAFAVHLLHSGTRLGGFGKFHKRHSFWLFRLLVFNHPNVLDFTEGGKSLPNNVLGDGFTSDQKQATVRGIIEIRRRPVVVLHFPGSLCSRDAIAS